MDGLRALLGQLLVFCVLHYNFHDDIKKLSREEHHENDQVHFKNMGRKGNRVFSLWF